MIKKRIELESAIIPMFQIIEETSFETEFSFNQENNISNNSITLHQNCFSKTAIVKNLVENYPYTDELEKSLNFQTISLVELILDNVWTILTKESLLATIWLNEYISILIDEIKMLFLQEMFSTFNSGKFDSVTSLKELRSRHYIKMLPERTQQDLDILNCIICERLLIILSPFQILNDNINIYFMINNMSDQMEIELCKNIDQLKTLDELIVNSKLEHLSKIQKTYLKESYIDNFAMNFPLVNQEVVHINEQTNVNTEFHSVKPEESISNMYCLERLSLSNIQENIFHLMTSLNSAVSSEIKKQYLLNGNLINYKAFFRGILSLLSIPLSYNDYELYVLYKNLK